MTYEIALKIDKCNQSDLGNSICGASLEAMSSRRALPTVVAVDAASPAARSGLQPGDEIVAIDGEMPRDVIRWQLLTDAADPSLLVERPGGRVELTVAKAEGEPLGAEVHAAVFDRVQTCDNHCEFCFIHQLPKGMRRSLYLKDDDYRLSFLYGNFTTLTRFTELDFERVITERLSPLHVSIHAADPALRAEILHNRRGAVSLRWLRLLLDHGIEVHGQIVVCPGLNDAAALEDTLCGVLERFSELLTVCVVPLGVSRFSTQPRMRPHTGAEARRVLETVHRWQEVFLRALGRRVVFAADEYYLAAGMGFPDAEAYEGFLMHEDGIGMARTLAAEFDSAAHGTADGEPSRPRAGFFAWVDGAPADGYRAPRSGSPAAAVAQPGCVAVDTPAAGRGAVSGEPDAVVVDGHGVAAGSPCGAREGPADAGRAAPAALAAPVRVGPGPGAPVGVLTGTLGAQVIEPLVRRSGHPDARVIAVDNRFFGGNIGVTGLMVGSDVARVLAGEPEGHRYLLPDVCLSRGVFLDSMTPADLPRPVEVVPTDGFALHQALQRR